MNNSQDLLKIPPFRDSHIHFSIDGKPAGAADLESVRNSLLRCGILQVTDMGLRSGIGVIMRDRWRDTVRVATAGTALYRSGGYGSFIGEGLAHAGEISAAVDRTADAGADFIKAVNSGIVLSKGAEALSSGGFSFSELTLLVNRARQKGLAVACHANSDRAVREAVDAGVSSIEHGFFVTRETLDLMAEREVAWTPTANALFSIIPFIDPAERTYIEDVVDGHCEKIGYAAAIGVRLNIGSDAGSKGIEHGASFFAELRMFRKAGLSLNRILAAACMKEEDAGKGNYLMVTEDFIEKGTIDEIHFMERKEEETCLT